MKRTKDVFVGTYNNGIVIEGLPYNMKKDAVVKFAQEMLAIATQNVRNTMSNLTYIANPIVAEKDFADFSENKKAVALENVDFIADYNTREIKAKQEKMIGDELGYEYIYEFKTIHEGK